MIVVFSDLHGNADNLQKALPSWQDAEAVICLGDSVGYRRHPEEALRLVRECSDIVLLGNHDAAAVGRFDDFLELLPAWLRRTLEDVEDLPDDLFEWLLGLQPKRKWNDWDLVHGSLRDPLMEFLTPEVAESHFALQSTRIAFAGHTHQPLAISENGAVSAPSPSKGALDISEGRWVLNPGSLGIASAGPAWLEIRGSIARWHFL